MKTWMVIATSALFALLAAGLILLVSAQPRGEGIRLLPTFTPAPLTVQVDGAVPAPGLYTLPRGSRLNDALRAAGGLVSGADSARLNLAHLLADGDRISVPTRALPTATLPPGQVTPTPAPLSADNPLELNTATVESLDLLPGIGPAKAAAIVAYRVEHGPFTTLDDMLNVPGIGPALLEQIRPLVTVDGQR